MRAVATIAARFGAPAVRRRTLPWGRQPRQWASLLVCAIIAGSVLVQLSPAALTALEFDRRAIAAGQWWRVVTGSFVHYDWRHLAVNLGTFAGLCLIASGRSRSVLGVVLVSAVGVGLGVYVWADGIESYRGVSGVDCAVLAWLLMVMALCDGGKRAAMWIILLAVVSAKFAFEMVTGYVLLPTSAPQGVAVVGVTHVVGLAIGALTALVSTPECVRKFTSAPMDRGRAR